MKFDELAFMMTLADITPVVSTVSNVVNLQDKSNLMPANRATYLLNKWARKGWWEHNNAVLLGHFTEEGLRIVNGLRNGDVAIAKACMVTDD